MIDREWIICERSQRWAAALRVALDREPSQFLRPRIYEVRNLNDMLARLAVRPASLVLIEVNPVNFAAALACLTEHARHDSAARFVVLMDGPFSLHGEGQNAMTPAARSEAIEALGEAGASESAISPRHLSAVLRLGKRRAEVVSPDATSSDISSLEGWARALLPWQGD